MNLRTLAKDFSIKNYFILNADKCVGQMAGLCLGKSKWDILWNDFINFPLASLYAILIYSNSIQLSPFQPQSFTFALATFFTRLPDPRAAVEAIKLPQKAPK